MIFGAFLMHTPNFQPEETASKRKGKSPQSFSLGVEIAGSIT